jgi:acetyl-CoA acyltransferase 1
MDENDVVIVGAWRTPFGKAGRGSFKDTSGDYLLYHTINESLIRAGLKPECIGEVVIGNMLSPGGGVVDARMAALRVGIPVEVPVMTVNRQCGSGLEAVYNIASKIREGRIEIGVAGGYEFMTKNHLPTTFHVSEVVKEDRNSRDCLLLMGETSEVLAEKYGLGREEVDNFFAYESHEKALNARERGDFKNEIIPIPLPGVLVENDDGVRRSTREGLSKLKPVFRGDGVSTAGNSSQLSDGASVVILAKRKTALKMNLKVYGVFADYVSVGVEPCVMGIGPAKAIPKLLDRNKLRVEDVEVFEINEAFGSQALCCMNELGIKRENLNRYGGAIAIGHPVGCTGGRLIATLLNVMRDCKSSYGVVSLCVGSGMGVAALIYKE